jgi:hypothetical protein
MQAEVFDPVIELTSASFETPEGVRNWFMDMREAGKAHGRLTLHFSSIEKMEELYASLGQHIEHARANTNAVIPGMVKMKERSTA